MQAIILSVGDELVLGQTVDTNSAYLSAQLAQRGIGTAYHQTLADDMATIAEAIRGALGRCNILLISGGLGPTEDDLTRHALAEALGEPLVLHEPSIDHIEAIFQRHGRTNAEATLFLAKRIKRDDFSARFVRFAYVLRRIRIVYTVAGIVLRRLCDDCIARVCRFRHCGWLGRVVSVSAQFG